MSVCPLFVVTYADGKVALVDAAGPFEALEFAETERFGRVVPAIHALKIAPCLVRAGMLPRHDYDLRD